MNLVELSKIVVRNLLQLCQYMYIIKTEGDLYESKTRRFLLL